MQIHLNNDHNYCDNFKILTLPGSETVAEFVPSTDPALLFDNSVRALVTECIIGDKSMGDTLSPDSLISHYRIVSKLGEGGMAEVYLAQDMKLARRVAIKFLPPKTSTDPHARKRLVREAQAAATLEHQNICAVYEVGEADGHTFIVMQYVEGTTLHEFLHGQALDLPTVLSLANRSRRCTCGSSLSRNCSSRS